MKLTPLQILGLILIAVAIFACSHSNAPKPKGPPVGNAILNTIVLDDTCTAEPGDLGYVEVVLAHNTEAGVITIETPQGEVLAQGDDQLRDGGYVYWATASQQISDECVADSTSMFVLAWDKMHRNELIGEYRYRAGVRVEQGCAAGGQGCRVYMWISGTVE